MTILDLLKKYKIKIPVIQRDYAQGRKDSKTTDIRNTFLSSLFDGLADNSHKLHLDFIYGYTKDENTLYLLDGQQRITTLFLLYWYLSVINNKTNREILKNFTYETRISSKLFIENLISKDIKIVSYKKDEIKTNLSEQIKNKNWFFLEWQKDPTIKAMFVMLDDIHIKYSQITAKPKLENFKNITFDFLNMEGFSLGEDLYIKMNARGKQLTEFENFKAWLNKFIDEKFLANKNAENENILKNWKEKVDTSWTDLFWKFKDERNMLIDEEFMRFFRNIIQIYYSQAENYFTENSLKLTAYDAEKQDYIFLPNSFYKELNVLNEVNLIEIFTILDLLVLYNNKYDFKKSLEDIFPKNIFWGENSIFEIFIKFFNGNITYYDKLLFYAFVVFLLKNKNIEKEDFLVKLKQWMRVFRNLLYNTDLNKQNIKNVVLSIKNIDTTNIFEYFENRNNEIEGFNQKQLEEEILKSELILTNKVWEQELLTAENHWYLTGQVKFLIDYSNKNIESFKTYRDKFFEIFDEEKIKDNDYQVKVIRALLTIGDYLPNLGGNKYSFGLFDKNKDYKKATWSKIFVNPIFKTFLDELSINSLDELINNFDNKTDWRYYFVKYSELIKGANWRQIEWLNKDEIYLCNGYPKNKISPRWRKKTHYMNYLIYSYCLHENCYEPFKDKPWGTDYVAVLENFHGMALDIDYNENKFELRLFPRNNDYNSIKKDLKSFINSIKSLKYTENVGWYKYININDSDDILRDFIRELKKFLDILNNFK